MQVLRRPILLTAAISSKTAQSALILSFPTAIAPRVHTTTKTSYLLRHPHPSFHGTHRLMFSSDQIKQGMSSISCNASSGGDSEFNQDVIDIPAWYTDDNLSRSDMPTNIKDKEVLKDSQFVIVQEGIKGTNHWFLHDGDDSEEIGEAKPMFLSYDEVTSVLGGDDQLISGNDPTGSSSSSSTLNQSLIIWIGKRKEINYFSIYLSDRDEVTVGSSLQEMNQTAMPKLAQLREFGDRILSQSDAALYATANGLVEFHKSHKFCSYCGSPTASRKAGASRICSDHKTDGGSCRSPSIYPRIDVASIMLVTSPCGNYALLGRKSMWPKGRYSTLAGFMEVGETIEQCCIRETFEESGIEIEKSSVEFVRSQPWPFPRSLMAGFRARAKAAGEINILPQITIDEKEMEDVQWFHRDFVAARLDGGSTSLMYRPTEEEQEFHIPGKASLAKQLITQWALGK